MYTVMRFYRDEYGRTRCKRWNMRTYKRDVTAKRIADSIRGGFVCPLGSNDPVYVGAWQ